jgi:hypothetical protein
MSLLTPYGFIVIVGGLLSLLCYAYMAVQQVMGPRALCLKWLQYRLLAHCPTA